MTLGTIKITGYTGGTLDLTGNNPYSIAEPGWRPAVSRRRDDELGGPLYEDMEETIPLNIVSSTKAGAITAHQDLVAAVEQANRWRKNENIAAVLLEVDPDASGNPVKVPIIRPAGDRWMSLSPTWRVDLEAFAIGPFDMSFIRHGALLDSAVQRSRTTSTSFNPGVMTPSSNWATSVNIFSPLKLDIDLSPANIGSDPAAGFLLVGKEADHIILLEGEAGSGSSGNFATHVDADASGGNVIQYTPNTTSLESIIWQSIGLDASARRFGIVVNLKNNSSAVNYTIYAADNFGNATSKKTVVAGSNNPQAINLGSFSSTVRVNDLWLWIKADSADGAGDELEIDTIAIMVLDNPAGRVIGFPDLSSIQGPIVINPSPLTRPSPLVLHQSESTPLQYNGDVHLVGLGNTMAALLIANSGTRWRLRDSTNAVTAIGMTVDRYDAHLVPE